MDVRDVAQFIISVPYESIVEYRQAWYNDITLKQSQPNCGNWYVLRKKLEGKLRCDVQKLKSGRNE